MLASSRAAQSGSAGPPCTARPAGSALLLRGRFLERSQFAPHVAVAAKAFSDVAREGECADRSPGIIEDDRKRKFDIDCFAGSVQRACGKRLAGVLGYARVERFFEAGPVSYPKLFGDDEVQVLAHRRFSGVSEDPFGRRVPVGDVAVTPRVDDCIGRLVCKPGPEIVVEHWRTSRVRFLRAVTVPTAGKLCQPRAAAGRHSVDYFCLSSFFNSSRV